MRQYIFGANIQSSMKQQSLMTPSTSAKCHKQNSDKKEGSSELTYHFTIMINDT